MGLRDGSAAAASHPGIVTGALRGGPNPIQQGNVILWETATGGFSHTASGTTAVTTSDYGSTADQLGSAVTNSSGYFTLPSFNCDPGEYLYITATGGKTASNSANPNMVLMAPVGPCSGLPSAVHLNISEASTMVMAFTLQAFISEDASHVADGNELVYIGAPAANNSATPGCTGTGAAVTCVANGLGMAFADAMDFVNSISYTSTLPNGTANSVPTDAFGNVLNATAVIPAPLIHTLANVLQSCVNTSGGTGGDPSGCGKLFTATTVNSVIPTDTLQAALSIARNPTNNASGIYTLALPVSAFLPALTSPPAGLALSVHYDNGSSTTPITGNSTLVSLLPDGTAVLASEINSNSIEMTGFHPDGSVYGDTTSAMGANDRTVGSERIIQSDLQGNIYLAYPLFGKYDPVTLARQSVPLPSQYVYGMTVDKNGIVYLGSSASILLYPGTGTTYSKMTLNGTANTIGDASTLAMDANANLWAGISQGSNLLAEAVASTCVAPDFCSSQSFVPGPAPQPQQIAYSADGTIWVIAYASLYEVSPTGSLVQTSTTPEQMLGVEADGAGNLFFAGGDSVFRYSIANQTYVSVKGCQLSGSGPYHYCNSAVNQPGNLQVDAAGAVWLPNLDFRGVDKFFGIAAPAWPSLTYAHYGVKPQ